jgi:hypothetical protein
VCSLENCSTLHRVPGVRIPSHPLPNNRQQTGPNGACTPACTPEPRETPRPASLRDSVDAMTIVVTCRCGGRFAAPPHLAGTRAACPACGQAIQVPLTDAAANQCPAPSSPGAVVACQCGQRFQAAPALRGRTVSCPSCRRPLSVPTAAAGDTALSDPLGMLSDLRSYEATAMPVPANQQPPSLLSAPVLRRAERRRRPLNLRPYLIGGGILAGAVLLSTLAVVGFRFVKVATSSEIEWKEHVSSAGRFAVLFPHTSWTREVPRSMVYPELKTEGVQVLRGAGKSAQVTVNYRDLPRPADAELDRIASGYVGTNQLIREEVVMVGQLRTVEVVYRWPDRRVFHHRLFCIGRRLYDLEWVAVIGGYSEEEVQKFFDSFRLVDESPAVSASPH